MHLFFVRQVVLKPFDIPLCRSSQVTHGCQVVNVTDVQIKLNGIMNGELRRRVRRNKGKEDCHGENSDQCNYCCPFAIRTASRAQTLRPLCLYLLQQSAFTLFSSQGVEEKKLLNDFEQKLRLVKRTAWHLLQQTDVQVETTVVPVLRLMQFTGIFTASGLPFLLWSSLPTAAIPAASP